MLAVDDAGAGEWVRGGLGLFPVVADVFVQDAKSSCPAKMVG